MSRFLIVPTLVFALSVGVVNQATAAAYTFTPLEVPGSAQTFVTGINDSGQVAGHYSDNTGYHGFVYMNGIYTTVDYPGAFATDIYGINASGQLVGIHGDSGDHIAGFIYANGAFTNVPLNVPPNLFPFTSYAGYLYSINDLGQAVKVITTDTIYGTLSAASSLYTNGQFTALTVPGYGTNILVRGINDAGQITGSYGAAAPLPGSTTSSFVSAGSTLTPVDVPGSYFNTTSARGINNLGTVAGSYDTLTPVGNLLESRGFIDSNGAYTTVDYPGALNTALFAINDFGQVVGAYDNTYSFLATPTSPVPEPASIAVLALGLGIVACATRRLSMGAKGPDY